MGNCMEPALRDEAKHWQLWRDIILGLNLSHNDFKKLLRIYQKMDKDNSGHINLKELLLFLRMENDEFMRRTFSVFDEDKSGEIDFGEFVAALWNYCTESRQSLMLFAFDLYDEDSSGVISKSEFRRLLSDIYGASLGANKFVRNQANSIFTSIDKIVMEGGEGVTFQDFTKLTRQYPNLLFATFEVHTSIQDKTLGQSTWEKLSSKQLTDPSGKPVNLAEYKMKGYHKQLLKEIATRNSTSVPKTSTGQNSTLTLNGGPRGSGDSKQVSTSTKSKGQKKSAGSLEDMRAWSSARDDDGPNDIQKFTDESSAKDYDIGPRSGRSNEEKAGPSRNPFPKSSQVYPTPVPAVSPNQAPLPAALQTNLASRPRPQQLNPITKPAQPTAVASAILGSSDESSKKESQTSSRQKSVTKPVAPQKQTLQEQLSDTELWSSPGPRRLPRNARVKSADEKALVVEDFDDDI